MTVIAILYGAMLCGLAYVLGHLYARMFVLRHILRPWLDWRDGELGRLRNFPRDDHAFTRFDADRAAYEALTRTFYAAEWPWSAVQPYTREEPQ